MNAAPAVWSVRLAAAAEQDFSEIVRWTAQRFGNRQAVRYAHLLSEALAALVSGPTTPGLRKRDDIAPGLLTLHVARTGSRGRHIVLCRVAPDREEHTIDVLRLLHDSMDIQQRFSGGLQES